MTAIDRDGERGAVSLLLIAVTVALAVLALAALQVAAIGKARWQAQSIADLAALTAAAQGGCAPAAQAAERNGGRLDFCRPADAADPTARVQVSVSIAWGLAPLRGHLPQNARAQARAGF